MKRAAVIASLIAGAVLAALVAGYAGFGAVLNALAAIGWRGFAALCAFSVVPFALLGSAWSVLAPPASPRRWRSLVLARVVRDAAGEVLPFSAFGGFVIGARAAILQGLAPAQAISTTILDVTAEFIGQLGFIALGLTLVVLHQQPRGSDHSLLWAAALGLVVCGAAAVLLVVLQRRGSRFVEALVGRWAPGVSAQASAVRGYLEDSYRQPARTAAAVGFHLAAWVVGAIGVWLALRIGGAQISLSAVLAIESLIYALRSLAFAAPMALGVQEAGYAFLGPLFGLSPELSIALSLIKRARDLFIGAPALIVWQTVEGRRLLLQISEPGNRNRAAARARIGR
jgi:putative membrane protein